MEQSAIEQKLKYRYSKKSELLNKSFVRLRASR
jgi:hypothetical protein